MATVRKRTREMANGRVQTTWVADYFDQHKKRHAKTFDTKKAAQAWLVETQGEVARGTHTPERNSITVYEAAQLWLQRCKVENLERGSLRNYETTVRLHIGPTLGAVTLARLTTPMLEEWRDRLLAGSEHRVPLSRICARKVLTALKAILADAQRRGLVALNPAREVKIENRSRDEKKLEVGADIPGKDEIRRLFEAATESRHRPLIITAALTGMRSSELRGLLWSAVDFTRRVITVRQRADAGARSASRSHWPANARSRCRRSS